MSTQTLRAQIAPYLQHKVDCATRRLTTSRDRSSGLDIMAFPTGTERCDCGMEQAADHLALVKNEVKVGVIEFHSNEALREDFYKVADGALGFIVDVWLLDIQSVLRTHGYDMRIYRLPAPVTGDHP